MGVRQGMDTGAVSVPCNSCVYYRSYAKCEAFPDGISAEHIQALVEKPGTNCKAQYHFVREEEFFRKELS